MEAFCVRCSVSEVEHVDESTIKGSFEGIKKGL